MTPEQIVDGLDDLVSLPDAVIRANELLDSPHGNAENIGEVISHDPALSAKLLKLVNSAFYSFPAQIDTVSRAITLIGTNELRSLIWASSATQVFNDITPDLIDMNLFWHRSVYCGLVAKKLAGLKSRNKGEAQFLTGLLHDVGHLSLFIRLPEDMQSVLQEAQASRRHIHEVEQEQLGFTSADIGSLLLESWQLPKSLWEPVRYQHNPQLADEFSAEAKMLNIALIIADCLEPELKSSESLEIESLPEVEFEGETLGSEELGMLAMDANLESFEVLNIINPLATTVY
ncbi:MAG: HDOD domain-containing protein [Motiliproteus sp.]|nr:HDOD domain-containing protein [Motiliproteus sp.]MCW9053224.1 HDOD domain-containing protein [Motiliproteus sp.]